MTETLDGTVDRFLEHKRALGRKYRSEEYALRLFLRFAADRGVRRLDQVGPAILEEFLASRPRGRARSFNHLLGVLRCMLDWAVAQELLPVSPLTARRRRVTAHRIPFQCGRDSTGQSQGPTTRADLPYHLCPVLWARSTGRRGLRVDPWRRGPGSRLDCCTRWQVREEPPCSPRPAHSRATCRAGAAPTGLREVRG
jgi:hypothetical protein